MTTTPHRAVSLDLPHEQAWVAHAALMSYLKRATDEDDPAPAAVAALAAVESARAFDGPELAALSEALATYLVDAPERDRADAERLLSTVERARCSSRPASGP